ncbi:hypothetical protein [Nocardioides litoris]|nr:hypothetical protein [Nocardioides litoris]
MTFFVILLVVVALVAAWKFRVPLLAKVLGQPERRVQRHLDRRRD